MTQTPAIVKEGRYLGQDYAISAATMHNRQGSSQVYAGTCLTDGWQSPWETVERAEKWVRDHIEDHHGLVSVTQASQLLAVSKMTVYRLVNTNQVESVRIGRLVRIPRAEIERVLAGQPKRSIEQRERGERP